MNFLKKFWRIPALALVVTLPMLAACADDDGAQPPGQGGDDLGTISGQVTNAQTGDPIVGALVGTNPATTTALTDGSGNYSIENVPIPDNPTSYAVTASADGFQSASATTSLSTTAPNVTVNLELEPGGAGTEGDLNVLVVRRTGEPVEGATVTVADPAGAQIATGTTNATGFALFDNLAVGSYTVTATASISGIDFFASGGANVRGGETAFLQLTLGRDFDQSVFPNVNGDPIELSEFPNADIRFVAVPGQPDDDPLIDCNIIRTQHMFIAEVVDDATADEPQLVSGVKVQWDLNIATQGICSIFLSEDAFLRCENIPGNTGSVVDSDDPDLDPAVARTGLSPAFNVDTRKAVTFTNDNDQVIAFNNTNVTVGPGQTWIIITSPVEGITDVIAATPDIPAADPDCANTGPDACDKEFAVKRWVNWDTSVAELDWDGNGGDPNLAANPPAVFEFLDPGQTLSNVLVRSEDECVVPITPPTGLQPAQVPPGGCELTGNSFLIYAEVDRLRDDSPFTLNRGTIEAEIVDDQPALEIFGEDVGNDGPGAGDGIQNVSNRVLLPAGDPDCDITGGGLFLQCDDQYFITDLVTTSPTFRDEAIGEFFATGGFEIDAPGWVVFEMRLDPAVFFCVDGLADGVTPADGDCEPGEDSGDEFSEAYQDLLDGTTDNTNTIAITFVDEFGEICGDFIFDKEWVTSRLQIIKTTPDATVRTVDEEDGGPDVEPNDTPRPVKTHTIQVGQEFSYTITVINDGEVASENVRITDTLPRFDPDDEVGTPTAQFFDGLGADPGQLGPPFMRSGHQAFAYVTDRPTFDPIAVVYAVDSLNNDFFNRIDICIRGDNGSATGEAYVVPAQCFAPDGTEGGGILDVGTVASARAAAEEASSEGDQVVWIQWFDDTILARLAPGGGVETEDTVEVTLVADEELVDVDPDDDQTNGYDGLLPGTWCDIATVTDGPLNLGDPVLPHDITDALALETESLDADTLCHEVREALLEVRKTTQDAIISAGAQAVFTVEIANNGSAPLTNTVIEDTLDDAFFPDTVAYTVVVDTVNFPGATVTQNGRFFTVDLGDFEPTDPTENDGFVLAYTVSVTTPGVEGVFCNRVTASGDTPAGTISDQDIACVTTTVTIELDVANEDGNLDEAGVFQSAKEQFVVGEGGDDADSLAFVYQISVTNQSGFAATNVEVLDEVAPNTGAIVCRGLLATNPEDDGVNPNVGTVVGGDCSTGGFTWDIGDLAGGQRAVLYFRAEALAPQNDVGNRVNLTADQLTGVIVDEEPTTVTSN